MKRQIQVYVWDGNELSQESHLANDQGYSTEILEKFIYLKFLNLKS